MEAEHQETCASMPVLYVAVGRRLDYPFKKEALLGLWGDFEQART